MRWRQLSWAVPICLVRTGIRVPHDKPSHDQRRYRLAGDAGPLPVGAASDAEQNPLPHPERCDAGFSGLA